jgi:hypothetical protein
VSVSIASGGTKRFGRVVLHGHGHRQDIARQWSKGRVRDLEPGTGRSTHQRRRLHLHCDGHQRVRDIATVKALTCSHASRATECSGLRICECGRSRGNRLVRGAGRQRLSDHRLHGHPIPWVGGGARGRGSGGEEIRDGARPRDGKTYVFYVTARNSVGTSPPSAPSPPVTPEV